MSAKDKVHEAPRDEVEDSQASSGSRRKKKDPKAPKRPLSAYNIYFKKIRQQLLDTQAPRLGFEALVKKVSAQWREVDTETRAVCEAEAKVDYERYFEEMKAYRARPDVRAALENPDAKGKRKFVGVPKRPLSGYTTYVQEEHARIKAARLANPEAEAADEPSLTGEIARRWSKLDAKEKAAVNLRAANNQKAYEAANAARALAAAAKAPLPGQVPSQMMHTGVGLPMGGFPPQLAAAGQYADYARQLAQFPQANPYARAPGMGGGAGAVPGGNPYETMMSQMYGGGMNPYMASPYQMPHPYYLQQGMPGQPISQVSLPQMQQQVKLQQHQQPAAPPSPGEGGGGGGGAPPSAPAGTAPSGASNLQQEQELASAQWAWAQRYHQHWAAMHGAGGMGPAPAGEQQPPSAPAPSGDQFQAEA